ncbi:MAG: ZIP family metal transporter [archaeon]|nr:ZIP family metal transporter [archaeon]
MILGWIILFSILGSVGAICAASVFLLFSEKTQKSLISMLITFATGTLLTTAFLGLLPEAIESVGDAHLILPFVLAGILFFFFLEKLIIWRNCQDNECEVHSVETAGSMVLIGDAFHNFTDGIVIAAAFLTNFSVGLVASLSILAHEIPQETGDFGILLHSGFSKRKAFMYNILSSCFTIPAAIIGYFLLDTIHVLVPYMLAISAASFLYISLSDLAPELHQKIGLKYYIRQLILILAGVTIMSLLIMLGTHGH